MKGRVTITRRENERVILVLEDGRQVEIRLHELTSRQVRVSVLADKSIKIRRADESKEAA